MDVYLSPNTNFVTSKFSVSVSQDMLLTVRTQPSFPAL